MYLSNYLRSHYDRFNFKVITPPTEEHITLAQARDHLRIVAFGSPPTGEEDDWLTTNISVAREWCESWAMVSLCVQTLELGLERFPLLSTAALFGPHPGYLPHAYWEGLYNGILLPHCQPYISIDSVTYDDSAGNPVVMDPSDYYVNDYERPAKLYPAPGTWWPVVQWRNMRAVRIRYTCGYSLVGASPQLSLPLPFRFRAAMLLVLGHLYNNREETAEVQVYQIPLGAAALMEGLSARFGIA